MSISSSTTKPEQFINDLVQFYRNRGIHSANASQFVARLNGKTVDLSVLYSSVLEFGGSYKVNQANLWDEIFFKLFKTRFIGANFAVALRQIYNRYLLQYEKSCSSNNFNSEQWNDEDDDENAIFSHATNNNTLNQYSSNNANFLAALAPKENLNNVLDANGQVHNDSKLYCSLLSGLPNELNFAFDVATILSNCNRFDWKQDYKFINVLLDSIMSYCCVCDYYEERTSFGCQTMSDEDEVIMFEKYIQISINKLSSGEKIKDNGLKIIEELQAENCEKKSKSHHLSSSNDFIDTPHKKDEILFIQKNCGCYIQYWCQSSFSNEDVLSLILSSLFDDMDDDQTSFSTQTFPPQLVKKIEKRIELVAGIVRNISFTYDPNITNQVSMTSLLKFLILLLYSNNTAFVNISLDIIANIASALPVVSTGTNPYTYFGFLDILLEIVSDIAFNSNNIHDVTKSFEFMARFITPNNNDANSLLENYFTNEKLYERITQLLTCPYDISLLLAILEFCLTLSETRPYFLVNNENKTFLKILLNLLNCQVSQHFTSSALKKMKILDARPLEDFGSGDLSKNFQHKVPSQTIVVTNHPQQQPTKTTIITNQQNIVQNSDSLDNESFAINWLRFSYEELSTSQSVKFNDMYAEYVKHCCRNSRKNVIASQSFNFLLIKCFPSCHINPTGMVDGLVLKNNFSSSSVSDEHNGQSLISSVGLQSITQPNQKSPILKAHLSTPPKIQIDSTPNCSNTANTSSLIKTLLANKLRGNAQQIVTNQISQNVTAASPVAVVQANESLITSKLDMSNNNQLKNPLIITSNSNSVASPVATSFSLAGSTISFSNNLIATPNTIQNQPQSTSVGSATLPGSQQIFLVRTIITGPGQQNTNTPVRLILPASMITQQRFQTPNGLVANSSLPTNTTMVQQAQVQGNHLSNQIPVIQNHQVNLPQQNVAMSPKQAISMHNTSNQGTVITTPASISAPRSSIANSSPLLNVLLDKGKLPDFPSQTQPTTISNQPNQVSNELINQVNASVLPQAANSIQTQQQPKMFILTTTPTKPANTLQTNSITMPINDNITKNETKQFSIANNTAASAQLPIVNGDLKSSIKSVNPDLLIKHALSNTSCSPEITKRLKTSNSIDEEKVVVEPAKNSQILVSNNSTQSVNNNATVMFKQTDSSAQQPAQNLPQINSVSTQNSAASNPQPITLEYECQWDRCQTKFLRPSDVFYHVHSKHIMTPTCPNLMNCLWGGPEGRGPGCLSKRPKLSLLTHLQDFHCNPVILKQEAIRKKQLAILGASSIVLPQPPAHPGYAQNAAMLAIRRYPTKMIETAEPVTALTPLTVSIRLTVALILRNLAKRSHLFKRSLEIFESQLCEISATEGRDESRTIAQCLAVLSEKK